MDVIDLDPDPDDPPGDLAINPIHECFKSLQRLQRELEEALEVEPHGTLRHHQITKTLEHADRSIREHVDPEAWLLAWSRAGVGND